MRDAMAVAISGELHVRILDEGHTFLALGCVAMAPLERRRVLFDGVSMRVATMPAMLFLVAIYAGCSSSSDDAVATGDAGGAPSDAASARADASSNDAEIGSIHDASEFDGTSGDAGAIDWSPWSLQEPDGTTRTTLAGAHDSYFFSDGVFQSFVDTATGDTTSGSQHPRTELREKSTWKASATNTLDVTGKVTMLGGGSSGKTTVGQVFNDTDSIPLLELVYLADGTFEVLYEEAKGAGTYTALSASAPIGAEFTYRLALSSGQLTVSIGGTSRFTMTPSATVSGNDFYFKAGNYDQTAVAGTVTTTPYTIVDLASIVISHS
jgi:hypothetical protein